MRQLLSKLDVNKAAGPDGITNRILKETAAEIAPSLSSLFNLSLSTGVFPVFKKGSKDHFENYRPISLLSNVSKLMERCVLAKRRDHMDQLIYENQHGFMPGKSCTTQLVQVLDSIGKQLDRGRQSDIIYLDMSKAFDTVRHTVLLQKLEEFKITGSLHSWFSSYLCGRRQRVTIPGGVSPYLPVTSGVPQGSILGPVLFLIYVNDRPKCVSSRSSVAFFADDTKLIKTINSIEDAQLLQQDLNNVNNWATSSGLTFNEIKTKAQTITRKRLPVLHQYTLNGQDIAKTDAERDLGIWVTRDLTWSMQVGVQSSAANKLLGCVRRGVMEVPDTGVRRTIYLAIARSHLGYSTQVRSPQSV